MRIKRYSSKKSKVDKGNVKRMNRGKMPKGNRSDKKRAYKKFYEQKWVKGEYGIE